MEPDGHPIWGRELAKRWQAKGWPVDEFVLVKLIDSFDIIATDGYGNLIFIDGTKDSQDHICEVYDYCFDRNTVELFEIESHDYIERLILKHEIDNKGLNAVIFPRGRDPKKLNRWKRRLSNINAILDRGGLKSKERNYLLQRLKDAKEEIRRLGELLPTKMKSRPNQIAKSKCREVASKLWEKDPQMTIADMINQAEILKVSKKSDGTLYTEKTMRNWIKDLCPNRSAGRRKQP